MDKGTIYDIQVTTQNSEIFLQLRKLKKIEE